MFLLISKVIDRELISRWLSEELARRKTEGKLLGRPKGSYGVSKLDQYDEIGSCCHMASPSCDCEDVCKQLADGACMGETKADGI